MPALDRLDDERRDVAARAARPRARSRSPNGTRSQPGSSGPKPSLKNSSPTSDSGPSVTPWKLRVAREQPRAAGRRARELHRRVDRLGAGAREEHRVEPGRQPLRTAPRRASRPAPSSGSGRRRRGRRRASPAAPRGRRGGCGRGWRSPRRCGSRGRRARRRRRGSEPRAVAYSLSKPRIRSTSTSDGSRWRAARSSVSSARAAASATTPRGSRG